MVYAELICVAVMNLNMPHAAFACGWTDYVVHVSEEQGIDPTVMVSLIHYESRWTPSAVSKSGACGLTQVLPRYTKDPRQSCRQLKDPYTSIETGTRTLRRWISKYGKGNLSKGLCGYNAGYTCGRRYSRRHGGWRYSRKVQRYAKKIRDEIERIEKERLNPEGD